MNDSKVFLQKTQITSHRRTMGPLRAAQNIFSQNSPHRKAEFKEVCLQKTPRPSHRRTDLLLVDSPKSSHREAESYSHGRVGKSSHGRQSPHRRGEERSPSLLHRSDKGHHTEVLNIFSQSCRKIFFIEELKDLKTERFSDIRAKRSSYRLTERYSHRRSEQSFYKKALKIFSQKTCRKVYSLKT